MTLRVGVVSGPFLIGALHPAQYARRSQYQRPHGPQCDFPDSVSFVFFLRMRPPVFTAVAAVAARMYASAKRTPPTRNHSTPHITIPYKTHLPKRLIAPRRRGV